MKCFEEQFIGYLFLQSVRCSVENSDQCPLYPRSGGIVGLHRCT